MQLEQHYIKDLIASGEGFDLDFKYHVADTRKIAKTLVSFANTRGGKLLLGVKDNGKVIGVQSDEEGYMIETAANFFCDPEVSFTLEEWEVDGKTVLLVDVPSSSGRPHYAKDDDDKWWVYVRVNDKNKFANRVVIEVLNRKKSQKSTIIKYSRQENQLLDFLDKNQLITIKEFCRLAQLKKRKAENILINLIAVGVVGINHNERHFYYTLQNENVQPVFPEKSYSPF